MAEQCRVAFCLRHLFARVCRAEHPLCHGIALRTGPAHHRDAARTGGGGDGGNGRSLHSCSFLPGAFGRRGNGVLGASRRPGLPRERTFGFYSLFYHVFSQKDTPTDGFFHIFRNLGGKTQKNYFNFVVPESLRTAWGSIFTGGFSPGCLRPFSDSLALSVKSCGFASSPKGRALGRAVNFLEKLQSEWFRQSLSLWERCHRR